MVGYYNTGDDYMKYRGTAIRGIGPVLIAGPLLGWVIGALEGTVLTEGVTVIGAALNNLGIPKDSAHHVKAKFLQHVTEKRAHADQLAERIVQLGSKPDLSPERLLTRSHAEQIEGESLVEMITADLLDERLAIDGYRDMIAAIGSNDPTTQQVLTRILAQEEAHAESLDGLLRE